MDNKVDNKVVFLEQFKATQPAELRTYKVDKTNKPIQSLDDKINDYLTAERKARLAKDKADNLKNDILKELENLSIKSYDTIDYKATQTPQHKTKRFDSKAFKAEYATIYEQFKKQSVTKASVKITKK